MNPMIFWDNMFAQGTPTATDTASGYDIVNVADYRPYTYWYGASAGTKYLYPNVACSFDSLFIMGHNLSTAGAIISVEYSLDNATSWTEALAPFTPDDDTAIFKTFTKIRNVGDYLVDSLGDYITDEHGDYIASATAKYARIKIDNCSVAPYCAIAMVGERMTFPCGLLNPGGNTVTPFEIGITADTSLSKTGNILGSVIRYNPVNIEAQFASIDWDWFRSDFWPFWRDHGRLLYPFVYAPDAATFTDDYFWVTIDPDDVYSLPLLTKALTYKFTLKMLGVLET